MCDGGAHHPSTSTFGVSAGAVNPHVATAHTGAGFYIIDKHFKSFADNFDSELSGGDIVHRRDIEPAFLTVAAEVYRAISMRAQAAAGASPRRDSGDSASAIISSGQQPAAASLDPFSPQPNEPASDASLCDLYPNLHASNFVEHSTASRLHARLVSHRVHILQRKRPVAIDARGQLKLSKGLRKCDTPARRAKLSSDQAQKTLIRRRTGHANHGLAGLPNDPPAQPAAPTGPVQFVPRKTNDFSSTDESPSLMTGDEEWPPDDDCLAVDAGQPSSEDVRTSPPLGTSVPRCMPMRNTHPGSKQYTSRTRPS
jgi:hypothetical protein